MVRRAFVLGLIALVGCGRSEAGSTQAEDQAPSSFRFGERDAVLLTWIDGAGRAHSTSERARIPDGAREAVRVELAALSVSSKFIYVASLAQPDPDGQFIARRIPRSEWEDAIAERRANPEASPELEAKRLPEGERNPTDPPGAQRGPGAERSPGAEQSPQRPESPSEHGHGKSAAVIVYGASWCGPCHDAERHLTRRNVEWTFKDIEKTPAARDELQAKIRKTGRGMGSIPVIDVEGQLLVGFSPSALDQALRSAGLLSPSRSPSEARSRETPPSGRYL